jgi:hypothetical protein
MNMRLFHPEKTSDRKYRMTDKMNGWTKHLPCRFLEWSGWYNLNVSVRLLGHYRLFQHFKKEYSKNVRDINSVKAYIAQYRYSNLFKYFLARLMALPYSILTWRIYHPRSEVKSLNRQLVDERSIILQDFLASAHTNFELALATAVHRIRSQPHPRTIPMEDRNFIDPAAYNEPARRR